MKRTEIERLLPVVFQRTALPGNPLTALLQVMEVLHQPSEGVLRNLDAALDPRRAPDAFVPFLARWVDLEPVFDAAPEESSVERQRQPISTGLGRLRELVAAAAQLSRWRGTARGLLLFLETATGVTGFTIDEQVSGPDGLPRPYHIRVHAPASTAAHRILIERIIELEKPVHVTYQLEFEPG
ncbi:MAG: phage tail protein [Acidobacteriota bacterium]